MIVYVSHPEEKWVDIKGYEGLYAISNTGKIKSFHKKISNDDYLLKLETTKSGYLRIHLSKNSIRTRYLVHRLVATHFVSNPNNYPQVNHIDENKTNNIYTNLEWCTAQYNNTYNDRAINATKIRRKKVAEYDTNGVLLNIWDSLSEASRKTGVVASGICDCCNGNQVRTRNGHTWVYLD